MTKEEFIKKAKVAKRYTIWNGRRFARIQLGNWTTDVLIRAGRNDTELLTAEAKEIAWQRYAICSTI